MSVMLDANLGGYSEDRGWDVSKWDAVNPVESERGEIEDVGDGQESDPNSVGAPRAVTLSAHSRRVEREASAILAALFHDVAKVHPALQTMLRGGEAPSAAAEPLAKSEVDAGSPIENARRQFRHEIGTSISRRRFCLRGTKTAVSNPANS